MNTQAQAVAVYLGWQEAPSGGFGLWNLLIDLPGHPSGSTVARSTIESHGYTLPAEESLSASDNNK